MTEHFVKKAVKDFVESMTTETNPEKREIEIKRVETFIEFFQMIRTWRKSLPTGHQNIPKPFPTKGKPYQID